MHPSIYLLFGTIAAGLVFLLVNREKVAEHFETTGSHGGQFGGDSLITARREGADRRLAEQMLKEVEQRLKRIRRMPSKEDQRRAVEALRSHYDPSRHAATGLAATYALISEHIEQRLISMQLHAL